MKTDLVEELRKVIKYIESGKYDSAQRLLNKILANDPINFDALYMSGVISGIKSDHEACINFLLKAEKINPNHAFLQYNLAKAISELGEETLAVKHHQKTIELMPDNHMAQLNFGKCLFNLKLFDDALRAFNNAIELKPDYAEAFNNRGNVLKEIGRFDQSLYSYEKAIDLLPSFAEAYSNLGNLLRELKRFDEALESYDKAIELKPNYEDTFYNRGIVLTELNRLGEAIDSYQLFLLKNPSSAEAHFALAALGVGVVPEIMPKESVVSLFDSYAGNFDASLVQKLDYKGPQILLNQYLRHNDKNVDKLLDLGCGTGLSGEAFCSKTNFMVGVDLSEGMLSKARLKNIYSELVCSDILDFLETKNQDYDLIICADTLIYIGNLVHLFKNIKHRLKEKGFFSFTIENSNSETYELKISKRYGHSINYIKYLSKLVGFSIMEIEEFNLRKEQCNYISGSAILMRN